MSLVVLCPTRGRPAQAQEAYEAFAKTRSSWHTNMVFILDHDDPALDGYVETGLPIRIGPASDRRGLTDPLNWAVAHYWNDTDVVGFVGDDHRFRTQAWDRIFEDHLRDVGGGLIYGFDGNWRDGEIPTQIFGSAKLWRTLGWMALPTARHLYLDNAWRYIGEGLGRLYYFPDVVIEHMHPAFNKAEWDEQYRALNNPQLYGEDGQAFGTWIESGQADRDVERVRLGL